MIATYHIKVNGEWINPGETYEKADLEAKAAESSEPAEQIQMDEPAAVEPEKKPARRNRQKDK